MSAPIIQGRRVTPELLAQVRGLMAEQRQAHLGQVANNSRFLILPWVRVPELASHILGRVARRLACDWQAHYGHRVVLLETFVERERFRGGVIAPPTGFAWARPKAAPARTGSTKSKRR